MNLNQQMQYFPENIFSYEILIMINKMLQFVCQELCFHQEEVNGAIIEF